MASRPSKSPRSQPAERPLLSHSTILILSSFLIGIAAGRFASPAAELAVYLAGAFGVTAYFGLGQLARKRQQRTEQRALERAAQDLESRMDRHIPRLSFINTRRDQTHVRPISAEQYLTVSRKPLRRWS